MLLDFDRKQLEEIMDKIVERTMRMDMTWDWPCGVAYYGISKAYEVTGKEDYFNVMKERIDKYITLGLPEVWTVNTCAMGHCLITLYQATSDEKYLKILKSKIDYLKNDALRFADHVLQHTVSADNDFPQQCWADTLFMAALFMLRYGVMTEDNERIEDALHNYFWHIQYLQNEDTGKIQGFGITDTIILPKTICPAFTGDGQTAGPLIQCLKWGRFCQKPICIRNLWRSPAL